MIFISNLIWFLSLSTQLKYLLTIQPVKEMLDHIDKYCGKLKYIYFPTVSWLDRRNQTLILASCYKFFFLKLNLNLKNNLI